MFRPGTVNEADYSPQEQSEADKKSLSFGNIQKISQEGSKNTYVIILSKDCIKGETAKGPPIINCPPVGNHGRALPRRPVNVNVHDNDFDSPTLRSSESQYISHPTEDLKLNLSNINDDDYDSNTSATNVFLKPELQEIESTLDSAIEADLSENSNLQDSISSHSNSYFCEKSKMNTYVIPSPLTIQQEKRSNIGQHTFPTISPPYAGGKHSLLHNNNLASCNKLANSSSARKIFLVTPEQGNGSVLKKSVAYTNEAVPTMGKSKVNDFGGSVSLLNKTNPKAVPTFNNISPINQTQVPSSSFIPINPSASPAFGTQGPYTSTPVSREMNPRLQQLKHESSTHRPVYIIQSPFSRQSSTETPGSGGSWQVNDWESSVIATSSVPTLNNSSGFISGSSSLELFEASSSVDSPRNIKYEEIISNCNMEACDNQLTHQSKGTDGRLNLAELPDNKRSMSVKTYELDDGSGGVVVQLEEDTDGGVCLESEPEPSVTSSQESEASDILERGILNKSLTNIQWLKGMQLKDEKSVSSSSSHCQQNPVIPWKSLSEDEIKQIGMECGCEKRPPFSYMSMIQMALYSREDRKMMLKEICKWIEETFPYYKHTAKPGWKNSIRHNLSLYNIFERSPAKRHGSYWTIKPDMEPKPKPYKERNSNSDSRSSTPSLPSQPPGAMIPIIPMYSSMGQLSAITPGSVYMQPPTTANPSACKKKGPPPILPRPSPYGTPQAYALIPINNVGQQFGSTSSAHGQQPMIVNLSNSGGQVSACPSPGISEMSAAVASIQVSSASPIPMEQGNSTALKEHKYTKVPTMNIVKQAWLDCQSVDTASSVDSDIATSNDMTSSNEIASSSDFSKNRSKSKRPRIINSGLPKPTMYIDKEKQTKLTGSKRRKLQQKERPLLNDSSDEEVDEGEKFISDLVKDLTVPGKPTVRNIEDPLTTSTPLKSSNNSSIAQLPSPISNFTPLRNAGLFDGSFLDTLTDQKVLGLSPSPSHTKNGQQNESPNSSLLDFVTIPPINSPDCSEKFGDGSPDVNNPNLSRFLTECGLDPNFVENTENFPHLNWSSIQQIVDSMDTSE